jgi:chromosome segregation ATPase
MAKVSRANAALRLELDKQRAEVDALAGRLQAADDAAKKAAAAAKGELLQATAHAAAEADAARGAQKAAEAALEASRQEGAGWKAECASAEAAKAAEGARGEDKARQLRCAEEELEAREGRIRDLGATVRGARERAHTKRHSEDTQRLRIKAILVVCAFTGVPPLTVGFTVGPAEEGGGGFASGGRGGGGRRRGAGAEAGRERGRRGCKPGPR